MKLDYWINDIIEFLRRQDFQIDPLPKIFFNEKENASDNILIRTGYYDANNQKIVLFTNNRHVKDILRSFVHEIVHHHQYLSNKIGYLTLNKSGKLKDNPDLRKLESEAYLYGNLFFRMYTEEFQKDDYNT